MIVLKKDESESLHIAAKILQQGGVGVIPTDTLYGLSGIVPKTAARIQRIKRRAEEKLFIRLIAKPADIFLYTSQHIPHELLSRWPAPLTFIVQTKDTSGTCAFRCPADEWLRNLVENVGTPLYSTSVNYAGNPALTDIAEIMALFSDKVDLIVNAGQLSNAASTIVDISRGRVDVIRQGLVQITP